MAATVVNEGELASGLPAFAGDATAAPALSEPESVLRSAGIVSLAVILSRLSGLVREMVMAYTFGAGASYDAFLLAFRIPNLPRDLFGEGAFSAAFVPTFTRALVHPSDNEDAPELARQVTSAILVIVGCICLLGMLFAPQLVALLAPGFESDPAKFKVAVHLTRIMFPFLLLISLSSQATGMLNAQGSFGLPATASIFFNVGAVGVGLLLGYGFGPSLHLAPVEGMAYGVLAGGFFQLAWQLPRLHAMGFRFVPLWKCTHPGLRLLGKLMLPAFLASLAMQVNMVINTSFASRFVDPVRGTNGPVSWLGYALRFVQVPMGVFAVALASAMLPSISRSAAAHNFDQFKMTLSRSLSLVFFLTLPAAIILIVLGRPIVGAIYQSGHFQAYDTQQTSLALSCYAIGLIAFASARLLIPAFYALSDARTPMLLTLLSIGVNIALPLFLLNFLHMNFAAMALTTSLAMTMEALLLFEGLRRKLGGLDGTFLMRHGLRILAAALAMAAPLALLHHQFSRHFAATRLNFLLEVCLLLPLAMLFFIGAAKLLRVEEIRSAGDLFWKPMRRYLSLAGDRIRS
jgi:putative peptidoglycan lipid II flippase